MSHRSFSPIGRRVGVVVTSLVALLTLAACGSDGPSASADDTTSVDTTRARPTTTTAAPTTTTTVPPTTTAPPPPPPPPPQVAGSPLGAGPNTVYVLGDSVILGAQTTVPPALVGWNVTFDAAESRRIDQGTGIVQAKGGAVGRVLVVHLCTNWGGGDYFAAASRLLDSLTSVERVVWVTCTPWIPAVGAADEAIRSLPRSYPKVVVADWAAISRTPDYTYADGLHLKPAGAAALARLVSQAVGPAPA
ncbi:MAG TPA: hypothetical protein VIY72_16855 [Acidimicrobiales bacterium]